MCIDNKIIINALLQKWPPNNGQAISNGMYTVKHRLCDSFISVTRTHLAKVVFQKTLKSDRIKIKKLGVGGGEGGTYTQCTCEHIHTCILSLTQLQMWVHLSTVLFFYFVCKGLGIKHYCTNIDKSVPQHLLQVQAYINHSISEF